MISDQELECAIETHVRPRRDEAGRRLGDDARRRETHDMYFMREGAAGRIADNGIRRRQVPRKDRRRALAVEDLATDLLAGERRADDAGQALALARDFALLGRTQRRDRKGPDVRARTRSPRLRTRGQRAEDGFDPSWLPARFGTSDGRGVFALWWFVFPNLTLNFYPWGLSINVYQPVPGRPEATRFGWFQLAVDGAKHAERDRRWLSAQVDAEDVDTLAQVSRGLRSDLAPRGRFAPDHEQAAHWFHRRVARLAFGG